MPNYGEMQAWAAGLGAAPSPATITPSGSPFSYVAPRAGRVYIAGGTVTLIETGRNGTFVLSGVLAGAFPVSQNDVIRVTYAVAPTTMTFMGTGFATVLVAGYARS